MRLWVHPDEGAVPDFGIGTDDAGRSEIGGGEDLCGLVDPDVLGDFRVVLPQGGAQGQDHVLDPLKSFPGISKALKIVLCQSMIKIIKIVYRIHIDSSLNDDTRNTGQSLVIKHKKPYNILYKIYSLVNLEDQFSFVE